MLAGDAPDAAKIAAVEALHRGIAKAKEPEKAPALEALRAAAASPAQSPAVRAAALAHLGYAIPELAADAPRDAAARTLLAALAEPALRLPALRGLAAAAHGLPESVEEAYQNALLDLLGGTLSEDERVTGLLALGSFQRGAPRLAKRRPDLCAAVEARLLPPLEADPSAYAASGTPSERAMLLSALWGAARRRAAAGDAAGLDRLDAALKRLAPAETDPGVRAEIAAYLAAPPPAVEK